MAAGLALMLALATGSASATGLGSVEVRYEPVDLVDDVVGRDLWLYRYTVHGFDTEAALGLSIGFALGEFSALSLDGVAPPPADWDVLVLQPDAQLPADGLFDALALTQPAASSGPLEVAFVWSGAGVPGAQPFVLYDDAFATTRSGTTMLVPEPTTGLLVLLGLAGLGVRRRVSGRTAR